jgi:hypothetical protein
MKDFRKGKITDLNTKGARINKRIESYIRINFSSILNLV